jgi:hypothetical protein
MRGLRGTQQQRRGVHGAARDDDQRRPRRAPFRRFALDLHGSDPAPRGVGEEAHARSALVHSVTLGGGAPAGRRDIRLALRVELARERVARVAQDAAVRLPGPTRPSGSGDGCSPRPRSRSTIFFHLRRVRHRLVRERPARRLGRIHPALPVHVVQALRAVVKRLERPRSRSARPARRRRRARDRLEVLAPQPVQHAAPELRVAADAVVRVGQERRGRRRSSHRFAGAVAQLLPDRFGAPVVGFLRDEVPALEDQELRRRGRQRVRHRAAAGAGPDDDDVVARGCRAQGSGNAWQASRA